MRQNGIIRRDCPKIEVFGQFSCFMKNLFLYFRDSGFYTFQAFDS